jgi:hypothetical protein
VVIKENNLTLGRNILEEKCHEREREVMNMEKNMIKKNQH